MILRISFDDINKSGINKIVCNSQSVVDFFKGFGDRLLNGNQHGTGANAAAHICFISRTNKLTVSNGCWEVPCG